MNADKCDSGHRNWTDRDWGGQFHVRSPLPMDYYKISHLDIFVDESPKIISLTRAIFRETDKPRDRQYNPLFISCLSKKRELEL